MGPSKATIKKKALLNFRAIKNNYVVKNENEVPSLKQTTTRNGLFTQSTQNGFGEILSQERIGGLNSHRAPNHGPPAMPQAVDMQTYNR